MIRRWLSKERMLWESHKLLLWYVVKLVAKEIITANDLVIKSLSNNYLSILYKNMSFGVNSKWSWFS
jgi:hypothetical protein